jgi:5'-3' exonuclease
MGVQDLSKELRASKNLVTNLSDYSEKILGVDASIWLNKAIFASPEISLLFHQEPRVTVGHLIDQFFDRLLSVFEANSIKILFVIDGARNPLKALTNDARKKKSSEATEEMENLIMSGDFENMRRITAQR